MRYLQSWEVIQAQCHKTWIVPGYIRKLKRCCVEILLKYRCITVNELRKVSARIQMEAWQSIVSDWRLQRYVVKLVVVKRYQCITLQGKRILLVIKSKKEVYKTRELNGHSNDSKMVRKKVTTLQERFYSSIHGASLISRAREDLVERFFLGNDSIV